MRCPVPCVPAILALAVAWAGYQPMIGRAAETPVASRPNVIVLLIDDMGWKDLSCQGSGFYRTPHIDRLAASGVRFTSGYSACTVCSPTRASILTGQYPARLRITDWIPGHDRPFAKLTIPAWQTHLPLETVTVAERLKATGYATASIGKWHLGGDQFGPTHQGFDENVGGTHRGEPPSYFSPYKIPTLPDGPAGEYLTDREAAEAVRFIERHRDQPFFLYLPHHCVHGPIQAKPDVAAKYESPVRNGDGKNAAYAAMVESVDDSVGRILDLSGVGPEPTQPLDGVSLAGALRGGVLTRDALYWHYPHYHPGGATPHSAIRAGDFRLVHFYEDGRNELYDLRTDPGETTDLAAADPARTLSLKARLDDWLADVGGQMPTANAAFDPVRDGKRAGTMRKP